MNETVLLVVDYEKICRLCLQSTGAMTDIFEHDEGTSLQDLVHCCTGLEVRFNDGLPSKICHKCRYVVELSCELRDMAAKTHQLLTEADKNLKKEYLDQEEKLTESCGQDANTSDEGINRKKHKDLKLVLQDDGLLRDNMGPMQDGVLTLVKIEPVTPVDDKAFDLKRKDNKKKDYFSIDKIRKAPPKHLTCQICLTSFPTTEEVSSHVHTHYLDSNLTPYLKLQRPYKCEACNSGIISKTKLIVHHRSHLNVNPFICKHPGCDFVGKNKDSLRHHAVCHGARSQVCEACGARYRRRWELRQHAARAHAAPGTTTTPRHCRACRKTFRNALTYRAHLLRHHRPPRHACKWAGCTKAYYSPAALAAHARAHAGDRVFRCHLCSAAAYTSQSLLNRHLRMHERARMSKCDKCSATFDDYGAFYQHRISEHGPWQPYRCVGCNKGYQTEDKLKKHVDICEQAIRMNSFTAAENVTKTEDVLVTSIEEIMQGDSKTFQLVSVPGELFKGQSLLVQPGNINDLSKDLVLQELPADGLLYIEVDSDAEEEIANESWQQ